MKNVRTHLAALPSFAAAAGLLVTSAAFGFGPDKTAAPAAKPAPAHCAVTDEVITDPAGSLKTTYNGKTYYFCCGGCPAEFAKNPAKNAKIADLHDDIRAAEKKLADLKAALADAQKANAPQKAAAPAPAAVAAAVYCAVTDETLASPAVATATALYNGKTYYFCCGGCKTKFDKDPATLAKNAAKRVTASAK